MQHLKPLCAGVTALLCSAGAVHADLGDQLFKLLADDGAENDWFGFSVGISGTIGIAGARGDDDNGPRSGSAYLFDATTGRQIAKLLADDGEVDDGFGDSVAISGATAIVGALGENGDWAGSAYLFDVTDPSNPVQIAKLLPEDGAALDFFGSSVAVSGATAVVGAFGNDDNDDLSGSAYLFDTTTGDQLFKLLADDGAEDDRFGRSVAISGATAIVGAINDGFGSAYLFDTTSGRQTAKLLADDGEVNDSFGFSVAISGATAIVSALGDDDNGRESGSAYLFDISDPANPVQVAKLLPDDGYHNQFFGYSVGISGAPGNEIAMAGVGLDEDLGERAGAAYLFDAGTCIWDLDDSGGVGTGDLILLLGLWGHLYGTPDLIELLGNWGPCR